MPYLLVPCRLSCIHDLTVSSPASFKIACLPPTPDERQCIRCLPCDGLARAVSAGQPYTASRSSASPRNGGQPSWRSPRVRESIVYLPASSCSIKARLHHTPMAGHAPAPPGNLAMWPGLVCPALQRPGGGNSTQPIWRSRPRGLVPARRSPLMLVGVARTPGRLRIICTVTSRPCVSLGNAGTGSLARARCPLRRRCPGCRLEVRDARCAVRGARTTTPGWTSIPCRVRLIRLAARWKWGAPCRTGWRCEKKQTAASGDDGDGFEKDAQPPRSMLPSPRAFACFPPPSGQSARPQTWPAGRGQSKNRRACPCSEKLRNLDCEMG